MIRTRRVGSDERRCDRNLDQIQLDGKTINYPGRTIDVPQQCSAESKTWWRVVEQLADIFDVFSIQADNQR